MSLINPDIRIASCSNKWKSATLVTLNRTIIQIVKKIYAKIYFANILNTDAN